MEVVKNIALIAHDNKKPDMVDWVSWNWTTLVQHNLISTGTTGRLVEETIHRKMAEECVNCELRLQKLLSGPLGGDQQIGAMIAEGLIDALIFFWDPMEAQPHDVDVKALLRITVVYDIPVACTRSSADFFVSSPLIGQVYNPVKRNYLQYLNRDLRIK
jgi:methylglyoxal synthase